MENFKKELKEINIFIEKHGLQKIINSEMYHKKYILSFLSKNPDFKIKEYKMRYVSVSQTFCFENDKTGIQIYIHPHYENRNYTSIDIFIDNDKVEERNNITQFTGDSKRDLQIFIYLISSIINEIEYIGL